jgi:hypothetical protein
LPLFDVFVKIKTMHIKRSIIKLSYEVVRSLVLRITLFFPWDKGSWIVRQTTHLSLAKVNSAWGFLHTFPAL